MFLLKNLSRTTPLKFIVPVDILRESLPSLGGFPLECTEESCPEFDKPTLFIRAAKSGYIQEKSYPVIQKMFPKVQVVELDGGHWIHVDQPEGVAYNMYVNF
jgi:pimeloyl-ACP methyl ester carboxylesterase